MRRPSIFVFPLLVLCVASPAVRAEMPDGRGRLYKLLPDSTYQHGCFAPCMCPVMEQARVRGTFRLALVGIGDVFDFYEVSRVAWRVDRYAVPAFPIRGSGFYKRSAIAGLNEMSLDLAVDADPVVRFDSGEVPLANYGPPIDLSLSIHGGYCFDTVIELRARPALRLHFDHSGLSWDEGDQAGGPYDVVLGDLGSLRATGGDYRAATIECLAHDYDGAGLDASYEPRPGEGYWFLARSAGDDYADGVPDQTGDPDGGIAASPGACK